MIHVVVAMAAVVFIGIDLFADRIIQGDEESWQ